jgi:uncharacterized protein YkwD
MKNMRVQAKKPPHNHLFGTIGNALLILIIIVSFVGAVAISRSSLLSTQMAAVISSTLVSLTNTDRGQNSLDTLTVNPLLVQAAQAKADDMASKDYFAHTSPEGLTSWYWFDQVGYKYTYAGENLAVDYGDSGDVERAWLNSPTHRANIMDSHYTQIGIATAVGTFQGHQATFVVEMFGAPARHTLTFTSDGTVSSLPAPVIASLTPKASKSSASVAGASTSPTIKKLGSNEVLGATTSLMAETVATTAATDGSFNAHASDTAAALVQSGSSTVATRLASSPKSALHLFYFLLSILILVCLVSRTGLAWKRHHLSHVVISFVLIALMAVLSVVAGIYVFKSPVLSGEAASRSL